MISVLIKTISGPCVSEVSLEPTEAESCVHRWWPGPKGGLRLGGQRAWAPRGPNVLPDVLLETVRPWGREGEQAGAQTQVGPTDPGPSRPSM